MYRIGETGSGGVGTERGMPGRGIISEYDDGDLGSGLGGQAGPQQPARFGGNGREMRESLDLIIPPPPISLAHFFGAGGGEVVNHNMEVVLYNPESQRVVIWDPGMGMASVHSTARTVCPFCHRPIPTENPHAHPDDDAESSYVSPHYWGLLSAQNEHPDRRTSTASNAAGGHPSSPPFAGSAPSPHHPLPALPPPEGGAEGVYLLTDASPSSEEEPQTRRAASQSPARAGDYARRCSPRTSGEYPRRVASVSSRQAGTGSATAAGGSGGVPTETMNTGYYGRFFDEQKRIGSGAYGSVYQCRHMMDGVHLGTYAVKIAPVGDNRLWLHKVLKEVNNLQSLMHRNVIRYMHSWLEDFSNSPFAPVVPCLFILMEYANAGNLHTRLGLDLPLKHRPVLEDDVVWSFFVDILSGVRYLHDMGIVHRDIKPENILIMKHDDEQATSMGRYRLMVSDLGQSTRLVEASSASSRSGCTGTVRFTAPEMLIEMNEDGIINASGGFSLRRQYTHGWTKQADVWSVGCCLFGLCFSSIPFQEVEDLHVLANTIITSPSVPLPMSPERPPELIELLSALLEKTVEDRPDLELVASYPMVKQAMRRRYSREESDEDEDSFYSNATHAVPREGDAMAPPPKVTRIYSKNDLGMAARENAAGKNDEEEEGAAIRDHIDAGPAQRDARGKSHGKEVLMLSYDGAEKGAEGTPSRGLGGALFGVPGRIAAAALSGGPLRWTAVYLLSLLSRVGRRAEGALGIMGVGGGVGGGDVT